MTQLFQVVDFLVERCVRVVVVFAMTGMMILIAIAVVARRSNFGIFPGWDEVVELMFAWMVFLGAMIHWRNRSLFTVDIVQHLLSSNGKRYLRIFVAFLMFCLAVVIMVWGWQFAFETGEVTPVLTLPKTIWYAALPVSGLGMTIYGALNLWRALTGTDDAAAEKIEDHI